MISFSIFRFFSCWAWLPHNINNIPFPMNQANFTSPTSFSTALDSRLGCKWSPVISSNTVTPFHSNKLLLLLPTLALFMLYLLETPLLSVSWSRFFLCLSTKDHSGPWPSSARSIPSELTPILFIFQHSCCLTNFFSISSISLHYLPPVLTKWEAAPTSPRHSGSLRPLHLVRTPLRILQAVMKMRLNEGAPRQQALWGYCSTKRVCLSNN